MEGDEDLYEMLYDPVRRRMLLTRLAVVALVTGILCPIVLMFDVPVTRWLLEEAIPGDFRKAIELSEAFAHGVGVWVILWGVVALSPRQRWGLPRLAILAYGGGAVATLVKLIVIRARPYRMDMQTIAPIDVRQWAWDLNLEQLAVYDAGWRSFPSGHAATAVGLIVGLSILFPRGRLLFICVGVMSMVQRVTDLAHFPSDVLAGAAIGAVWSIICLHPTMLGGLLQKLEPKPKQHKLEYINEEPEQDQRRAA